MRTLAAGCAAGFAALWLGACTAPPPRAPAAAAAAGPDLAPACADARALDTAASQLDVLVFRGGAAARLGHNHVAQAADLAGWACLPAGAAPGAASGAARGMGSGATGAAPAELAGTRFAFGFRLDALRLDDPAARAALGPGWASVLDAADVAGTRAHMLESLDAAAFPWVRVRSVAVAGQAPWLVADVEIELHGQVRRERVVLEAQRVANGVAGAWRASGTLAIRQSDWGIAPYAVLGGLLAVRDELVVRFALQTH